MACPRVPGNAGDNWHSEVGRWESRAYPLLVHRRNDVGQEGFGGMLAHRLEDDPQYFNEVCIGMLPTLLLRFVDIATGDCISELRVCTDALEPRVRTNESDRSIEETSNRPLAEAKTKIEH